MYSNTEGRMHVQQHRRVNSARARVDIVHARGPGCCPCTAGTWRCGGPLSNHPRWVRGRAGNHLSVLSQRRSRSNESRVSHSPRASVTRSGSLLRLTAERGPWCTRVRLPEGRGLHQHRHIRPNRGMSATAIGDDLAWNACNCQKCERHSHRIPLRQKYL